MSYFLRYKKHIKLLFCIVVCLLITYFICLSHVNFTQNKYIHLNLEYHFVYCTNEIDNLSASSLSNALQSLGGAGGIVKLGEKYYVVVACCYNLTDALSCRQAFKNFSLNLAVKSLKIEEIKLSTPHAFENAKLYKNNLLTLHETSRAVYNCAELLSLKKATQKSAKLMVENAATILRGLLKVNPNNCFTERLKYLLAECNNVLFGEIDESHLRQLQIAFCNAVINAKLY